MALVGGLTFVHLWDALNWYCMNGIDGVSSLVLVLQRVN